MKYIGVLLLFYIVTYSSSQADVIPSNIQSLVDELAEAGHRDISISQNADTIQIMYWPIGFRDDYRGHNDIKKRVLTFIKSSKNKNVNYIELIQTSWGIPTVTAVINCQKPPYPLHFTKKYTVSKKSNLYYPSKRFMILFDIPLTASYGEYYDPLKFKTGIRSEVRYRLSGGLIIYGQIDYYIHNEFDPDELYKPGNIGIMAARAFNDYVISVTNIGAFHNDIYGIDEEIQISLLDDKISLGLHAGYYGDLFFEKNKFHYYDMEYTLALLRASYSYDTYDCRIALKGGRFLYGDYGAGIELSRVFREIEIGFTGIKTKNDIAANVFFSIPFFPKSRTSLAKYGIAPVKHFKHKYWYYKNKLGREPKISTSLRNIEGLASPKHFNYMSRTFRDNQY